MWSLTAGNCSASVVIRSIPYCAVRQCGRGFWQPPTSHPQPFSPKKGIRPGWGRSNPRWGVPSHTKLGEGLGPARVDQSEHSHPLLGGPHNWPKLALVTYDRRVKFHRFFWGQIEALASRCNFFFSDLMKNGQDAGVYVTEKVNGPGSCAKFPRGSFLWQKVNE